MEGEYLWEDREQGRGMCFRETKIQWTERWESETLTPETVTNGRTLCCPHLTTLFYDWFEILFIIFKKYSFILKNSDFKLKNSDFNSKNIYFNLKDCYFNLKNRNSNLKNGHFNLKQFSASASDMGRKKRSKIKWHKMLMYQWYHKINVL